MAREVRTETDWLGTEHQYIYEGGDRIGEIRQETESSLNPFSEDIKVDVVYDNKGDAVSKSTYEKEVSLGAFSEETVYVTRDLEDKVISETRHEAIPSFTNPFSGYHDVTRDSEGKVIGKTVHNKTDSVIGEETHTYTTTDSDGKIHKTRSRDRLGRAPAHLGTSTKTNERCQPAQVPSSDDYGSYDNAYESGDGGRLAGNDASSRNNTSIGRILTSLLILAGLAFAIKEYRKVPEEDVYSGPYRALAEIQRADLLRISRADELLRQANELLERVERESANRLQESMSFLPSQELPDVNHKAPIEEYEMPKSSSEALTHTHRNNSRKNFDYTKREHPSQIPEERFVLNLRRYQAARRGYEVRNDTHMYNAIVSPIKKPRGYIPTARKIVDVNGNVSRRIEYMSKDDAKEMKSDEVGFTYPSTGRHYVISRERYPEFYRKLDRDGDDLISQYEISKVWKTFSNITRKYPEGNIELIVRDFMRKTEDKFGPFR